MTSAPARFVEYLRQEGYHPRSSAHGKALCDLVLRDLLDHCPRIREHAETGQLVFDVQRKIIVGASEWNIDLVLGSPSPGAYLVRAPLGIAQSPPTAIRIAIEAKTVMT